MKTGAELEAPAESSEAVDKKEKETDVRKQAAASRPRFRGEIQYEQLEQQRAAAESAPGSTVRILRTGGRSTAAEREDYRRVQPQQQGALLHGPAVSARMRTYNGSGNPATLKSFILNLSVFFKNVFFKNSGSHRFRHPRSFPAV